ncbi:hypothetical protein ACS0TY_009976 [Phlomoides rotata]
MESQRHSAANNDDKVKIVRGRRSWTKTEKDALIQCMTNIVSEGWKAENGLRAGFQRELERGIRKLLPGSDILTMPHINSKIHVWKKEHGALSDLLSKSGIGWNSTNSMIKIKDESVWESCKRADPHVKGVRFKTWPYYTHWIEIFGKDSTTGENAVDPIDLVNGLYRTTYEQEGETGDKYVPLDRDVVHEMEDNSICKHIDSNMKSCSNKGKKRKSVDPDLSMLVDSLGEFMKHSKEAMYDKGSGLLNENKQLNDVMKGIIGLKVADKIKVCDVMVQNQK